MKVKHEDIVLKNIFELLKDDGLAFFGIAERIVALAQTEFNLVELQKKIDDNVYLLENGNFLHLEFQSTSKSTDIQRFMLSDAILVNKTNKSVRTIVIYSANITEAENALVRGSLVYTVENFYMKNFDGDTTYESIKVKLENNGKLTKQELMGLVLMPLMKNSVDIETRIEQSIDLSKKIDGDEQSQIIAMLYLFADKFINDISRLNRIKEMISMTMLGAMIQEDKAIEIAKRLLKRGNSVKEVSEDTGLDVEILEKLQSELNK